MSRHDRRMHGQREGGNIEGSCRMHIGPWVSDGEDMLNGVDTGVNGVHRQKDAPWPCGVTGKLLLGPATVTVMVRHVNESVDGTERGLVNVLISD